MAARGDHEVHISTDGSQKSDRQVPIRGIWRVCPTLVTGVQSEARRLKQLEEENRQLKRIVADQALNLQVVKDLLGKQW